MSSLDDAADGVDGEPCDAFARADPLPDALRDLCDGAKVVEDLGECHHSLFVEVVLQGHLHVRDDLVYAEENVKFE